MIDQTDPARAAAVVAVAEGATVATTAADPIGPRPPESSDRRNDDRPRMEETVDHDLEPEVRGDESDESLDQRRDRDAGSDERP